jgi:NitT/TauT family transport system substrate-binding protein
LAQEKFNARIMRFSGDIWKNHPCCVITANENFIEHNNSLIQKALNAVVRAQDWCIRNPAETAHLLSRDGEAYLPFSTDTLKRVFETPAKENLVHPAWNVPRIGFQPFPFPSATRFIIDQMRHTLVEGDTLFLDGLDTAQAAEELVDNRFVTQAMDRMGGMGKFCNCEMTPPYEREEVVEIN